MCIVGFIYKGNQEFILTSNRDELLTHAINLLVTDEVFGAKIIYLKGVMPFKFTRNCA